MLADVDVDLWFTGEISHHEALAANEKGTSVITTFHSNSERAYMKDRMRPLLERQVQRVIEGLHSEGRWDGSGSHFEIKNSEVDADPFNVIGTVDQWS
jgi:putative NIF3 family GTP cyclohydrolase 1 type 2